MSLVNFHKLSISLLAAVALVLVAGAQPALRVVSSTGSIAPLGHMLSARSGHSATLLNDGRVLIVGGMVKNGEFLKTAEIYDPAKRTFAATGEMSINRVGQAAVLLKNGRVLIAGGWAPTGPTDAAELYDPATGKFTPLPPMTSPRARPTATSLPDGRVLITGGGRSDREGLRTAELFDPSSNHFTRTGDMQAGRIAHTADLLADGKVLVAGGMDQGHVTASADVYDPASGRFSAVGSMKNARYKHTSATLPDGRVLIAGGSDDRDGSGKFAAAEVYDPKAGKFSEVSQMLSARYKLPEHAALLENGDVLIAGGNDKGELFRVPENKFYEVGGGMGQPQWYMSETLLPDGGVLLAGGYSRSYEATSQVWLYRRD